jgi:hypothetical protein
MNILLKIYSGGSIINTQAMTNFLIHMQNIIFKLKRRYKEMANKNNFLLVVLMVVLLFSIGIVYH